jgi:hypothetical protein
MLKFKEFCRIFEDLVPVEIDNEEIFDAEEMDDDEASDELSFDMGADDDMGAEDDMEGDDSDAEAALANVEDAINKLMYKAINITGFSNDVGTVEIGTVISAVNLVWSLDKAPTEQSVDSPLGNTVMAIVDRALLVNGISLTTDFTFKLNVTDGQTPKSANSTVAFRAKRYHGVSAMEDIDDVALLALDQEFSTSKVLHASVDGGGMYIYFAFPESLGDVKFKVNGLQNTAWTKTTRDVTNAAGYVQRYNIYRSNTLQNGVDILIDTY